MLDLLLLVLFLVFVLRVVFGGLRQPQGIMADKDHGNVITIQKAEEWDAKLEEGAQHKKVIVVDFTATWCGPCRTMAPIFVDLSKKHPGIIFLKLDVDQFQDIAAKWEVQAMPTFIFIADKKVVHKIVGASKDELEKKTLHFSSSPHA